MIRAVVMAGGSGTRLWPLSRAGYPKQFLALNSDDTMLQSTFKRLNDLEISSSVTICNEEHRFFVADQLREIDKSGSIILEPVGRNTAPAIALAALATEGDPLLLVLAADHIIQDEQSFTNAVNKAIPLAEAGKLVTFGIVPNGAQMDFGYIKVGSKRGDGFCVDKFVEKPSKEVAQEYFQSGNYVWNSGMFLFRARRYLDELEKFRPDIYDACKSAIEGRSSDLDFLRIDKEEFAKCPSESIDYAVMEETTDAIVVPLDAGWNDLGSWSSLWSVSAKDQNDNAIHGDVMLMDTTNSFVKADDKLVALVGLDNVIVVSTKDAILVAHKDQVEGVKNIVSRLEHARRSEWELHREVYRPWGKFDSVDHGDSYQVKRITVKPGGKLSVQMHHHRAEHWVVVSGLAKVTRGQETFTLSPNESTFIPLGVVHSLENPGEELLEIIEIQYGTYLGEDDIVRLEDVYGR